MPIDWERAGEPTVSGLVGAIWRVTLGLSVDGVFRAARVGRVDVLEARTGPTWAFSLWGDPS